MIEIEPAVTLSDDRFYSQPYRLTSPTEDSGSRSTQLL